MCRSNCLLLPSTVTSQKDVYIFNLKQMPSYEQEGRSHSGYKINPQMCAQGNHLPKTAPWELESLKKRGDDFWYFPLLHIQNFTWKTTLTHNQDRQLTQVKETLQWRAVHPSPGGKGIMWPPIAAQSPLDVLSDWLAPDQFMEQCGNVVLPLITWIITWIHTATKVHLPSCVFHEYSLSF